MSSAEISNKEYHDKSLLAENRAKRLRNAIGGSALSIYGTLIILNQFDKPIMPPGTTASVVIGAVAGLVVATAYEQHAKAKHRHERAVEFAAFEVSESNREETEAPAWASATFQRSGKSIDEVLGPRSDK